MSTALGDWGRRPIYKSAFIGVGEVYWGGFIREVCWGSFLRRFIGEVYWGQGRLLIKFFGIEAYWENLSGSFIGEA